MTFTDHTGLYTETDSFKNSSRTRAIRNAIERVKTDLRNPGSKASEVLTELGIDPQDIVAIIEGDNLELDFKDDYGDAITIPELNDKGELKNQIRVTPRLCEDPSYESQRGVILHELIHALRNQQIYDILNTLPESQWTLEGAKEALGDLAYSHPRDLFTKIDAVYGITKVDQSGYGDSVDEEWLKLILEVSTRQ